MNISSSVPPVASTALSAADLTAQTAAPEKAADRMKLAQAVKTVNDSRTFGDNQELTFVLDRTTRRTLVRLIDRQTQEVVMQIPPEYVLRLAEEMKQDSAG